MSYMSLNGPKSSPKSVKKGKSGQIFLDPQKWPLKWALGPRIGFIWKPYSRGTFWYPCFHHEPLLSWSNSAPKRAGSRRKLQNVENSWKGGHSEDLNVAFFNNNLTFYGHRGLCKASNDSSSHVLGHSYYLGPISPLLGRKRLHLFFRDGGSTK